MFSTFALMTESAFFVGNDSGASHLAVCVPRFQSSRSLVRRP
ncbi:MAG: hypothetical protein IPK68_04300 [Bdellovibrionales bacterium]|nr:hypothetical protein [Bdellovibrionales bacterium]